MVRSVLILGGTGFLGAVMSNTFLQNGYKVFILSRDTKTLKDKNLIFCDFAKISEKYFFKENNIKLVINAIANYGRDGEQEDEIINSNYEIPKLILNLCIRNDIQCFINTDTFYNTRMNLPAPIHLYVKTKKDFVKYAKSICSNSETQFINAEIHHMYGANDKNTKFIPYLVSQFKANVNILNLSSCVEQRDFIHVSDVATAIFEISRLYRQLPNQIEIGTGAAVSLKQVVLILKDFCNASTKINFDAISGLETGVSISFADTHILSKIGWRPQKTLEQGLLSCVE